MGFPRRLLADNERLILDLRPHWISLVLPVGATVLIVGGVVAALAYTPASWPNWVGWAAVVVGIILLLAYPVRFFVDWVTSHFVVTSDRLIHREGWFAKRSMEIPLENINDVRFNQSVFERVIKAGDLTIESAGEFGQQNFTDIRDPEQVQKVIYETSEANSQRMYTGGRPSSSVADELAKLDRLRDEGVISNEEFEAQKARLFEQS
ncbi:MAG TPA: PH domain-containing protein [Actinomycetota bacterium]|nr:PH domain-containing protein [Actinomycetota bacterium]